MLFGTEFEHLTSERWLASMRSQPWGHVLLHRDSKDRRSITFSFVLATLSGAAAPAMAQDSEATEKVSVVDTVRVVRDRLPSDILDAAIAASIVDEGDLRQDRQIGLDDALDLVPGAVAQSRAGGQDVRITIRGFGARGAGERSNAGTTRGIRILLDGFPITEPDGRTSLDLADVGAMDRVRVVRSNSSVLFGSASGGLIDLVTHAPFDQSYSELRTSFGQFGLTRTHLKGGLVAGSARIRMSLSDTRFDGWRVHSRNETTTGQASI